MKCRTPLPATSIEPRTLVVSPTVAAAIDRFLEADPTFDVEQLRRPMPIRTGRLK